MSAETDISPPSRKDALWARYRAAYEAASAARTAGRLRLHLEERRAVERVVDAAELDVVIGRPMRAPEDFLRSDG